MSHPRKKYFSLVRRVTGVAVLGLVAACSLSDDDEDSGADGSAATAGVSGQGVIMLGGRAGGGEQGQSGSSGTAGSGTTEPPACENISNNMCGGSSVKANFKTVNILLVIDKSGSMDDTPSGFDNNKWLSMKEALDTALNRVAKDINVGLILYPFSQVAPIALDCTERCCEVPVGAQAVNVPVLPGLEGVPQVLAALDDTSPGGGTPTADALQGAIEYYTTGDGATLPGEKYVLLATDGGPNCNPDTSCDADRCTTNLDNQCARPNCCEGKNLQERCLDDSRVTEKVQALADAGIGTFVVGIPGTEAYASYLNTFAQTGGFTNPDPDPSAPDYYAVSAEGGVEGLVDVFDTITTQLVRACDIELASPPLDLEEINVYIDCEVIPKGDEDAPSWEVDAQTEPSMLYLKDQVCDRISARGANRVDVVYGCPTIR